MSKKVDVRRHKRRKPTGGTTIVKRHTRTIHSEGIDIMRASPSIRAERMASNEAQEDLEVQRRHAELFFAGEDEIKGLYWEYYGYDPDMPEDWKNSIDDILVAEYGFDRVERALKTKFDRSMFKQQISTRG